MIDRRYLGSLALLSLLLVGVALALWATGLPEFAAAVATGAALVLGLGLVMGWAR